jgi:hypothetical protein
MSTAQDRWDAAELTYKSERDSTPLCPYTNSPCPNLGRDCDDHCATALAQCDCCGEQKLGCITIFAFGLETFACEDCRHTKDNY